MKVCGIVANCRVKYQCNFRVYSASDSSSLTVMRMKSAHTLVSRPVLTIYAIRTEIILSVLTGYVSDSSLKMIDFILIKSSSTPCEKIAKWERDPEVDDNSNREPHIKHPLVGVINMHEKWDGLMTYWNLGKLKERWKSEPKHKKSENNRRLTWTSNALFRGDHKTKAWDRLCLSTQAKGEERASFTYRRTC